MNGSLARSVLLVVSLFALTAFAGWSKKGDSSVGFVAKGNIGMKITGTTSAVEVREDEKNLIITGRLTEIETGISLRNNHFKEDVEAEKFPIVAVAIPLESLKGLEDGKTVETSGKGVMTLHGKSNDIPFNYKAKCADGVCTIEANGEINLKHYDIKVRSYMGVTVKPEVQITANLSLQRK